MAETELGVKIVARDLDQVRRQLKSLLEGDFIGAGFSGGDVLTPEAKGTPVKRMAGADSASGPAQKVSTTASNTIGDSIASAIARRLPGGEGGRAGRFVGGVQSVLKSQAANFFDPFQTDLQKNASLFGAALGQIPKIGPLAQTAFQGAISPQISVQQQQLGQLQSLISPIAQSIAVNNPGMSASQLRDQLMNDPRFNEIVNGQAGQFYKAQAVGNVASQMALAKSLDPNIDWAETMKVAADEAASGLVRMTEAVIDVIPSLAGFKEEVSLNPNSGAGSAVNASAPVRNEEMPDRRRVALGDGKFGVVGGTKLGGKTR